MNGFLQSDEIIRLHALLMLQVDRNLAGICNDLLNFCAEDRPHVFSEHAHLTLLTAFK